jgi:uncharacterized membrane protein (UPF0127 family)
MRSPLIYRLQVEKSSHSVKFTFLYKSANYFIDYKFRLKIDIVFFSLSAKVSELHH